MSILVREEWYVFYKECEGKLEKIKKIMDNKDFATFYDEMDKEKSDHFHKYMIDIYNLCATSNPETRKYVQASVRLANEKK